MYDDVCDVISTRYDRTIDKITWTEVISILYLLEPNGINLLKPKTYFIYDQL